MILYALVIYIFWYKKVLQVGYTLKKYFKEIVKTYGSIVLYWVLLLTKSGTITLMNLHTQLLLKFDCPQKKLLFVILITIIESFLPNCHRC